MPADFGMLEALKIDRAYCRRTAPCCWLPRTNQLQYKQWISSAKLQEAEEAHKEQTFFHWPCFYLTWILKHWQWWRAKQLWPCQNIDVESKCMMIIIIITVIIFYLCLQVMIKIILIIIIMIITMILNHDHGKSKGKLPRQWSIFLLLSSRCSCHQHPNYDDDDDNNGHDDDVVDKDDDGDEDEENGDEADCDERDQFEYSAPVLASWWHYVDWQT